MADTYNGWSNRSTWNVALWILSDEPLHRCAVEFARRTKNPTYVRFIKSLGLEHDRTPDNIKWISTRLNYQELNRMMIELLH